MKAPTVDLHAVSFQPGFARTVNGTLFTVVDEQVGIKELFVQGLVDNHIIN